MSTQPYTTDQLATLWQREEISPEQMLGQLLVHINQLYTQLADLRTQIRTPAPLGQPAVSGGISSHNRTAVTSNSLL